MTEKLDRFWEALPYEQIDFTIRDAVVRLEVLVHQVAKVERSEKTVVVPRIDAPPITHKVQPHKWASEIGRLQSLALTHLELVDMYCQKISRLKKDK